MVDRGGLENRYWCKPIGGSNPPLSAINFTALLQKVISLKIASQLRRLRRFEQPVHHLREEEFGELLRLNKPIFSVDEFRGEFRCLAL